MGLAFATRNPSDSETLAISLLLSCYRDGSGAEREKDGTTRANWRQIERCFADLYGVKTNENKNIFDLVVPDEIDPSVNYGFSVKSKQLTKSNIQGLDHNKRVYMEIANSPAKFWDSLKNELDIVETDFTEKRNAKEIGDTIINTVKSWHRAGKKEFEEHNIDRKLDLTKSVYLCLSYSNIDDCGERLYQAHAFSLDYPENIFWKYTSPKCLSGYDPEEPSKKILDWYALSGGQLKYYPKGSKALWKTQVFSLEKPPTKSSLEKILSYFPHHKDQISKLNIFKNC